MSRVLVRKQEGPTIAPTIGAGGPGISFLIGGGGVIDPNSEEFQNLYGEVGSDSHTRAVNMQNIGRAGRYALAGLGGFNAAYNQTSSGQPGVIGAAGTGAMSGFYGSSGLEDFAARAGQRYGKDLDRYNYFTDFEEVDDPDIADPRGKAEPTDNMTTEAPMNQAMATLKPPALTDRSRLLAEPTANMTTAREMYATMGREFDNTGGRGIYNTIGREYGR